MTGDELRTAYLRFFESKGHKIIPSSSLIPHGDPTLLLTTAGVVQIKPYFMGESTPPARRLASCQKCFRTTDIESVGDATHLTFFEMLGNFSVGDYFKKEAISWAWEFLTQHLRLPPARLWITIFQDDDEAFHIWRQIGVAEKKIVRLGEKDNFWGPPGDSGPCGPCSEIYYDFGEKAGCGKPDCAPGCDCGRFVEFWNLVFTQYNQDKNGKRTLLPKPNIDTGMGLERTAAIMQGKVSVYETEPFASLLDNISKFIGKNYGSNDEADKAMRVVVEHGRALTFLIADGVMPSNEGRGYVLRRLLRRAALYGRRLGLDKPFLGQIAGATVGYMGKVYPELQQRQDFILKVIGLEEARFSNTLDTGLEVIGGLLDYREVHRGAIPELVPFLRDFRPASENTAAVLEQYGFIGSGWETGRQIGAEMAAETISQLTHDFLEALEEECEVAPDILDAIEHWGQQVSGDEVFKLHDTYGFPVELTQEIAAGRGFSIDMAGFAREMEQQREKARASHKFELAEKGDLANKLSIAETAFTGYSSLTHKTTLLTILVDNDTASTVQEGHEASLILESTPFYGEMGGQLGDEGMIHSSTGRFIVTDTVHMTPDIIVHQGYVLAGYLAAGDEVQATVLESRRLDIARNHTATHLLQAALRQILGEHIQQRGSLVAPDQLRFDFSHLAAMTNEEIQKVNNIVNERIRQNLKVYDREMPYKKAIKAGATALFAEKYGDVVRVLRIGRPPISAELCGGTHISSTGEIGFFHIIGESSIGAGLRRIEAVTGRGAEEYIARRLSDLTRVAESLQTKPEAVLDRAISLVAELDNETKRRLALERELSRKVAESLLAKTEVIKGVTLLVARVPDSRIETLREMNDRLREQLKSAIVVLGTLYEDKPLFLAAVTPDLVTKGYDAGKIVREVAKVAGGGGGGKATLAQAGGKDKDKLDEALKQVKKYIEGIKS